ncbi:hypothetical protein [Bradyrhizobium sp. NBAIM02]|uniref:hypothetical protein n=1 Tax=Bradyrhizobium sp. NBAIM02 TaxID=2793817 RepID=UPI001CD2052E|nr:hypothetical protein [Bradyrhizobium sp. NBAIM02]MCA1503811.1 hypothetical protein [Bradyrhizobium sp. NBAIM02]
MTAPIRLEGPIEWIDAELVGQERVDGRGRTLPDERSAIVFRNWSFYEGATVFFPGKASASAARELSRRFQRYRDGAWRRHRAAEHMPAKLDGRLEALFWHILKIRDAAVSERTIRRAIDQSKKMLGQHR